MRMIDRIHSEGILLPSGHLERRAGVRRRHHHADKEIGCGNLLESPTCFFIDNVAEYTRRNKPRDDAWGSRDFPNVAPPYPVMWFEGKNYGFVKDHPELGVYQSISKIGCLLFSQTKEKSYIESSSICGNISGSIHWHIDGYFFYEDGTSHDVFGPLLKISGDVNYAGQPLPIKEIVVDDEYDLNSETYSWYSLFWEDPINYGDEYSNDSWFTAMDMFSFTPVFLLAISFLHCKNVKICVNEPRLTRKQSRKSKGFRGLKYHTLEIEPMKRIIEREGDIASNGLAKALHICRGHFKDYSKGMGLFGKYKGVYWWPDTVRGSSDNGIVAKDYAVKV